MILCFGIFGFI